MWPEHQTKNLRTKHVEAKKKNYNVSMTNPENELEIENTNIVAISRSRLAMI